MVGTQVLRNVRAARRRAAFYAASEHEIAGALAMSPVDMPYRTGSEPARAFTPSSTPSASTPVPAAPAASTAKALRPVS